jgi:hypothetical protein
MPAIHRGRQVVHVGLNYLSWWQHVIGVGAPWPEVSITTMAAIGVTIKDERNSVLMLPLASVSRRRANRLGVLPSTGSCLGSPLLGFGS